VGRVWVLCIKSLRLCPLPIHRLFGFHQTLFSIIRVAGESGIPKTMNANSFSDHGRDGRNATASGARNQRFLGIDVGAETIKVV
jgi:hypothetical protein